jgi:peptidoglycan/LPS O-acetylase OafA/YrhL
LPLWSLIVEDALYACLALLFVFGMHRKVWVTLPILACLVVSSANITDAMTNYRLIQTPLAFFAGNLVYIFHNQVRRIPWWFPAAIVLASLMAWRHTGLFDISSSAGPVDLIERIAFPFVIASAIVLAITLPQIRWAIPDLSYGTYIWHGPIMMYLLANVAMARAMPWIITSSVLTLVAALLSWYLFEKRALRLKNVWFGYSQSAGSGRPNIASPTAGSKQAA